MVVALRKSIKVVPTKFRQTPGAFAGGVNPLLRRFQSKISLASLPTRSPKENSKQALSYTRDFSTQVQSDFDFDHAVLTASLAHQPQQVARELDITEAAANKRNFDKILLLINHGEAAAKKNDPLGNLLLTGRGVGEALTLSHKTSMWCNTDAGLSPELIVFAPLGCSVQTALHAFPYYSPDSVRGVSWICRGDVMCNNEVPVSLPVIKKSFPGMDLSHYDSRSQCDDFLEWLRGRQERVIVVSSTSTWLQSFCESTLDGVSLEFKNGAEMHAVGLY